MKAIKSREERMRVALDVCMVLFEYAKQKLMLRVVDSFDNETIVARKVKKGARLSRGSEFRKDVLFSERDEVICGIEVKDIFTEFAEHPWGVVFEFKIV